MRINFLAILNVVVLVANTAVSQTVLNKPAQSSEMQTSGWGLAENGLKCRVTLPATIEQGMNVPASVELQADYSKIPPGMHKLNASLRDAFFTLTLTDAGTGKQFEVTPFSDIDFPFHEDFDHDLIALNGTMKPWKVNFPLVTVYSNLAPADYVCQVAFSFPTNLPYWARHSMSATSNPASWWHGIMVSGKIRMQVLPETPREQVFWVPKRLVVTKQVVNLHPSDLPPLLEAIPIIHFHKADAQAVSLPVRNGHFLFTDIERPGGYGSGSGGALIPDNINPVDERFDYKGQDIVTDYHIEVIETGQSRGHLDFPGPGSSGYRLIWSKTFHISCTAKEFQRMPATVVEVTYGADERTCVNLIRANLEVEDLNLENAGITDADMVLISRLRHLRVLSLYNTDITDAGVARLRKMTHLQSLYLDGTRVTDAGVRGLSRLTRLEKLGLSNTSITDKGATVVSRFPRLKQLNLMNTSIGDATMAHLTNLKQLEWLDLRGTRVTGNGVPCLTNLVYLKDLRLPIPLADSGIDPQP